MSIFGCTSKQNCDKMDGEPGTAERSKDGWLIMSPLEDDSRCFPQTRTWKRRWFVLSLVRVLNTNLTNHYHLRYYAKENGKSPKGGVNLNTLTDICDQSQPPSEQLPDCLNLRKLSQDEDDLQACYKQLPFFSFEAEWHGHIGRKRIFLLAENALAMKDWVQCLRSACGLEVEPGPENSAAEAQSVQQPIWLQVPQLLPANPYSFQQQHRPSSPAVPHDENEGIYKENEARADDQYRDINPGLLRQQRQQQQQQHEGCTEDIYRVPNAEEEDNLYRDINPGLLRPSGSQQSTGSQQRHISSGAEDDGKYVTAPPAEFKDAEDGGGNTQVSDGGSSSTPAVVPTRRRFDNSGCHHHQQQQSPATIDNGRCQQNRNTDYENLPILAHNPQQRQSEVDSPDHVYGNLF